MLPTSTFNRGHDKKMNANDRAEELAKQFRHDTGLLAPFKDAPAAVGGDPEYNQEYRQREFDKWMHQEIEHWKGIALDKGWNTLAFASDGPICRMCHTECAPSGFSGRIWTSPKGGFYHRSCAIERLQREANHESIH